MDLTPVVETKGEVDLTRFRLHTRPSRASTGLGYARLLRFMAWRKSRANLDDRAEAVDVRLGILYFVEHLIQGRVGYGGLSSTRWTSTLRPSDIMR